MSEPSLPKPSPKGILPWLTLAIAIVGPPAFFLAFIHTVTQNPIFTILFVLIYEVIVFVVSFAGKIWQKLEGQWADQLAEWLNIRIQWILSSPQKRYCQYLLYQHRDIDIKGLNTQNVYTLDLSQVFVELSIVPTPVHETSVDLLQVSNSFRGSKQVIWNYLSSPILLRQHLVIIGPPGSGKTTLLKYIVLTLLNKNKRRTFKAPRKVPILLFLREHAKTIATDSDFSLEDAIHDQLKKWWRQSIQTNWIVQRLVKGQCLVLLDGLDEIADSETRKQVVDWVQREMIAYGRNRFIITSRPHGYKSYPLNGVIVLQVCPFTPKQIEQFLYNWYLANELMSYQKDDLGVRMKAINGAEDLLDRLRNTPALLDLATNPLLLTMIATVHRYRDTLPGKRVTLYAEICDVFLGKRQEAKGIVSELTAAQKRQVLQVLAYYMMHKGIRDIELAEANQVMLAPLAQVSAHLHPEHFLSLIENTSGLFLERELGSYTFTHLTIQEYLAAVHIREEGLEQELTCQVGDNWWNETIRLYCAQADATNLIDACISAAPPSVSTLTLAVACQQEALKVQPLVRTRLETFFSKGIEDRDPERSRLFAEALLTQRLQKMTHLHEEIYGDSSYVTYAEYQIFLDDQKAHGISLQPDHWQTDRFLPSQGSLPVSGIRSTDAIAFCKWLNEQDLGTWQYRLPKHNEYKLIEKDENADCTLTKGISNWTLQENGTIRLREIQLMANGLKDSILDMLTLDLVRTQDFALDLTSALNLAQELNLDLGLVLAFDRIHDLDPNRPPVFDHIRDRALEHAIDLIRKHGLDLDHIRTLDFTQALDLMVANVHSITDSSWVRDVTELTAYSGLSVDIVNQIHNSTRDLTNDLEADLNRAHDLVRNLVQALELVLNRDQPQTQERKSFLSWYIRFSAMILTLYLRHWFLKILSLETQRQNLFPSKIMESQSINLFKQAIKNYLEVAVAFVILEKRTQGDLSSWEGIMIVKERVHQYEDTK